MNRGPELLPFQIGQTPVATHERATLAGTLVRVALRGDGTLAFYRDGTGPHHFNRSDRRRHHRGQEGKHDGSKQPTRGRLARTDWRGAKPKPRPKPKGPRYSKAAP
jgi:hypothetical protein